MIILKSTDSSDIDFVELVKYLDRDLMIRDGEDHSFYAQFNKIATIKHVIVAYINDQPIGCGAIKAYNSTTMEVKRMFVSPEYRGKGVATTILTALEKWAGALGYTSCILETGLQQPEAIGLYKKSRYEVIPNYGQYAGIENSVCFQKLL